MEQWLESVYSDGTECFVSNPQPVIFETVTVWIRMYEDAPINHVFLRTVPNGAERLIKAEKRKIKNGLAYYAAKLEITESRMQYQFYLVCDKVIYYYNQKEITTYIPDQTYDFVLLAEYRQPSWVKNVFEYCLIDLIEEEELSAPIPMPENALSIEDFGAKANDGEDDWEALMDCIEEAVKQGKEVYIPAGEFEVKDHPFVKGLPLREENIAIRGAGMWHTVLKGEAAGFALQAGYISFYDFSLIGNVKQRKDTLDPPAFNLLPTGAAGVKDIRLQNIWIEHYKVGLWADVVDGISIMGCRIRNTYADGINLCAGTSHCVVTQNDLRNTGDDGIAMFNRGILCVDNKIIYNTVKLPWLANNIALYGGKDIEVSHNLLVDTICFGSGSNISTNFKPQVFEGTILVEENRLVRCGGREYNIGADYGAVWINTAEGYDNTIADCGTCGVGIGAEARGSAVIRDNIVTDAGIGELQNLSDGEFTVLE